MGLFNVDYKKMGEALLPPDKRGNFSRAWVKVMLSPIQWLRDRFLGDYKDGATYAPYNSMYTYAKYERIIYRYSVYESLVSGNLGNDPLDVTKWFLIQENFIGVDERIKYNGHALELTYALNKYFGTTFRQPPGTSDIYLTANTRPQAVFVCGGTDATSSVVFSNRSSEVVINDYSFSGFTNLSIWVPLVVYNALDSDPQNREQIVRNFADRYIAAGITYEVNTY